MKTANESEANSCSTRRDVDCSQTLIEECKALLWYIGRNGNLVPDDGTKAVEELASKISEIECDKSNSFFIELVNAYQAVTKITMASSGVNGRSVLDTQAAGKNRTGLNSLLFRQSPVHQRPLRIAIYLSLVAICLQIVEGFVLQVSDPKSLTIWVPDFFYYVAIYTLPTLVPAVWGGLGSCVFLMKQVNDRLASFSYEETRLQGYGTRILLGAIFGVIVVQWLFDTQSGDKDISDSVTQAVAAFAAGLGAKAVYTAFEAIVQEISGRIKGSTNKNEGAS